MGELQSPLRVLESLTTIPPFTSTTPRPHCEPDPLDPEAHICLAKVTSDDRQGISHFFGRNKKATASIPESMFPLLCRTHYQEKQYRWKEDATSFAAFQCDCILKTLERMAKKIFFDANGVEWPYWCGFELQIQRPGASAKDDVLVPEWLQSLCLKTASSRSLSTIGDRDGVRYSFSQLESIVKAIKTWCLQEEVKLPGIEALPVTIGMLDEADLEAAKKALKDATRDHTLALTEVQRHNQSRRETTEAKRQQLQATLQRKAQALSAAQVSVTAAQMDSDASKSTIPTKRLTKRARAALASPPASVVTSAARRPSNMSPEPDLDGMESLMAGRKRTRITLRYGKGAKRPKLEES